MSEAPKTDFSLILATVGRTEDPGRLLASLDGQSHRSFELIVVDQNPDDRLAPVLEPYKSKFPILHLRSKLKGVSRARNLGLDHATGAVVSFPDDDCLYPRSLLADVARFFEEHPEKDGLTGRSTNSAGEDSNGRYDKRGGPVRKPNVWTRGIEYSIFLRAGSVGNLRFDEAIGPGPNTSWGCGEGTDYLLRLLQRGASIHYDPARIVFHETPAHSYDATTSRKAYEYGCGVGFVLRRHEYPLPIKIKWLARPLGGALLSLLAMKRAKAKRHFATLRGRLTGMIS